MPRPLAVPGRRASAAWNMRLHPEMLGWIRDHGGTAYVQALIRADRKRRLAAERKARRDGRT